MKKIIIFTIFILTSGCERNEVTNKDDINKIVEDFIIANPEIMIESLERYSNEKEKESRNVSKSIIKEYYNKKTYNSLPSIGEENSDLILTEFIDYNCGYCKKTLSTITKLLKEVDSIKIVFVDYPILSETSELAARAVLAAEKQKKYFSYHSVLLDNDKPITKQFLMSTAESLNLNLKVFNKDLESEEIKNKIKLNIELAQSLKIRGTPTFIIGNNILPGAYDYNKLKEIILNNI
jgi:protein-disulfide isomerase